MRACLGVVLVVLLSGDVVHAQDRVSSAGPSVALPGVVTEGHAAAPSFGISQTTAVSFVAHAFRPLDSGSVYSLTNLGGNVSLIHTGGLPFFDAPLQLPTGALLEAAEARFCDSSSTFPFDSFVVINDVGGSATSFSLVSSTNAEQPGCVTRTVTFGTPLPIDNATKAYSVEVALFAPDDTIAFSQLRVFYRLQVSPAPATASFPLDVPTSHPFFQFVEALAAAGITSGCGPQMYCPDAPLTRGQMAVFLAVALGLHFPN